MTEQDTEVHINESNRNGRRRRRLFTAACGTILALGIASDATAMDSATCMQIAQRSYDGCNAQCEYQVDSNMRQNQFSAMGALNNFMNSMNQNTFNRAVDEGALSRSQVDYARAAGIGDCQSRCSREFDEMQDLCFQ